MSTILITGANKGLGYETARRLLAAGHTVYVGARDAARGQAAADALGPGARFVQIDVADDASVAAAAKVIAAEGGLDVLVNNAGVEPRAADGGFLPVADVTGESMRAVFEANVFGQVRTLHAFLPQLQASDTATVVNVSSGLALTRELADPDSFTHFYPGVEYPTSKAAVNMLTVQYAKAFPSIRINAVDPGYTATDLNHNAGTQTVEEGAEVIVRMAQLGPEGPTGGFFSAAGPVAW
ncbi:SDR family NAD(P)-dependent oxidoreductase [Catenulispora subtropica]|uniref:SDR family NAD(P)-dependent oxidoreductase n=1 Tax=Catenulispora subtropica TaxID=450798 RepID=A0ABN2SAE9_9ACTN